jgi:hypothetical protein
VEISVVVEAVRMISKNENIEENVFDMRPFPLRFEGKDVK